MKTFTHRNQPYGTIIFTIESEEPVLAPETPNSSNEYIQNRASEGWIELTGTIVTGSELSRAYTQTTVRDLIGMRYTLQVPKAAFEAGSYTTAAM